MRELVQLPMKTTLTAWPSERLAAFEPHVRQGLGQRDSRSSGSETLEGSGIGAVDRNAHAGDWCRR